MIAAATDMALVTIKAGDWPRLATYNVREIAK
jgi:hypothetical protein